MATAYLLGSLGSAAAGLLGMSVATRANARTAHAARFGLARAFAVPWGDLPDPTPTVVISDLKMPGWDGLAILRGLRQHAWCPAFILITGFGDEAVHREAARLGAHAVFDKPFDLDHLRAAVTRLGRLSSAPVPAEEPAGPEPAAP